MQCAACQNADWGLPTDGVDPNPTLSIHLFLFIQNNKKTKIKQSSGTINGNPDTGESALLLGGTDDKYCAGGKCKFQYGHVR